MLMEGRRRSFLRFGILFGALFLFAWIIFEWAIERIPIPAAGPPPATPVLLDIHERPFSRPSTAVARDQRPLPLRDLGPWLPFATIAIEDHRFWKHHGVDWIATAGATLRNIRNLRIISGASTITQQTVKILTGRTRRTLSAKARESLTALALERNWTKERILQIYLNRIDYGNRRFGAEAASQAYFGKRAADLSLAEAIFLAGIPQSPTRLNPWTHPQAALLRYRQNVARLAREGALPERITAQALLAVPPRVQRFDPPQHASHFAALAQERAGQRSGSIRTTLDFDLQHVTEIFLWEHLRNSAGLGIGDAAIVVIENATGEVRALASSGRSEHSAINAAMTPRSAGSTLKPFIYLAAIDRRLLTAATLLPDIPHAIVETYSDYDPQNYTGRSYGPVRVREALGNSLNVPAVVVTSRIGARAAFHFLCRWGLEFPHHFDDYGAGFILGNAEVRAMDLAAAYAGLARGGLAWPARILIGEPFESRRLASPEACAIITDILCDNEARRLSFGRNSPLNLGVRIAVKTGTSSGFRDRWCVGFTREHTVAVWAGNLNGKSLGEVLAVRAAAPLWASLIRYLLKNGDTPIPELKSSEKLIACQIAAETGLLPRTSEPIVQEWFLAGTEPKRSAAEMYANINGRETLILPPEYAGWCASPENRLGAMVQSQEFEISFPRDGAVFIWSSHLSPAQQVIIPQSTTPVRQWLLNGKPLEGHSIPLARGQYELTARCGDEERTSHFTVE